MVPLPKIMRDPAAKVGDIRRQLIANGYSPIPVLTGEKMPKVPGWAKLLPDADQVSLLLATHPDHLSTGLLTGELVAIDIDVMDEAASHDMEGLVAALPGSESVLARQGQAPKTLFLFRALEAQTKVATPEYIIQGKKAQVEVMGSGQQIVAFGIHPVTAKPYEWLGDSPLDIPFDELPEITPDQLADFLVAAEAVLAKHGTIKKKVLPARITQTAGGSFWRQVNDAALSNMDAWVPTLFPYAKKESGTGAWRVPSADLGRSLEEDISIHADGIQDFGEESTETAISLVQKWGSASTPKDAAHWLCERIGKDPVDLGWSASQIAAPVALIAANDNSPVEAHPLPAAKASGMPVHLCYPPGAVGDFTRWIVSCARFPSPHLALAASLAFTAALVGRRYKGPTGLRSNLYVVGLAESGFGKDITIRATTALADSTSKGGEVSKLIFMDEVRSLPGLAAALRRSPSSVTIIDEFGKWLGQHTGRNVAAHREEIATSIMALTGAPSGHWGGQEKGAGNIPRIQQPCFSIHGVSTPSTFWSALSSGNISEGLLGRLVLIDAGSGEAKKVRKPEGSIEAVPPELADQVHALLGGGSGKWDGGAFYALNAKSEDKPWPMMTVGFDTGVDDQFEAFDDAMRLRKRTTDPAYHPILNRVGENAGRLALIVAVGCDPKEPVITEEIQAWANEVAEFSFNTMLLGADANIADNEKSAEYLRVRQIIARKGAQGITSGTLVKSLRGGIETRRLNDILGALMSAQEIIHADRIPPSGQKQTRFWVPDHLPEDAVPKKVE